MNNVDRITMLLQRAPARIFQLLYFLAQKIFRQYFKVYWFACDLVLTLRNKLVLSLTSPGSKCVAIWQLGNQPCDWNFYLFLQCSLILAEVHGMTIDTIVIIKDARPHIAKWTLFENASETNRFEYRLKNLLLPAIHLFPNFEHIHVSPSFSDSLKYLDRRLCIHNSMLRCQYGPPTPHNYLCDFVLSSASPILPSPTVIEPECKHELSSSDYIPSSSPRRFVTITIRELEFDPTRNTDIKQSLLFADLLTSAGYDVLIIPDSTHLSSSWISNCIHVGELGISAASDHLLRFSLYKQAFCNFFVPHGFMDLVYFSNSIAFIAMKYVVKAYGNPDGSWSAPALYRSINTTNLPLDPGLIDHYRLTVMANKYQILNDRHDSLENLLEAFNIFLALNYDEPPLTHSVS